MLAGTAKVFVLRGQLDERFQVGQPNSGTIGIGAPANYSFGKAAGSDYGFHGFLRRQHRKSCAKPGNDLQHRMGRMAVDGLFLPEVRIRPLLEIRQTICNPKLGLRRGYGNALLGKSKSQLLNFIVRSRQNGDVAVPDRTNGVGVLVVNRALGIDKPANPCGKSRSLLTDVLAAENPIGERWSGQRIRAGRL